jgi:hypothetical protein
MISTGLKVNLSGTVNEATCLACTRECTFDCGFLFKSFGIGSIIDQIHETCTGEHRSAAVFLYK